MLLSSTNKARFVSRINALTPQSPPRFGKLSAAEMIVHLRITITLSLGEIEAADQSTLFSRTILCWLVYNVMPWPKGRIKVPSQYTPPAEHGLDRERDDLLQAIDRFILSAEREPQRKAVHPMFGPLTLRYWQKAHGKHFDHHLYQFGV